MNNSDNTLYTALFLGVAFFLITFVIVTWFVAAVEQTKCRNIIKDMQFERGIDAARASFVCEFNPKSLNILLEEINTRQKKVSP